MNDIAPPSVISVHSVREKVFDIPNQICHNLAR